VQICGEVLTVRRTDGSSTPIGDAVSPSVGDSGGVS
jgi:hypothetical protein